MSAQLERTLIIWVVPKRWGSCKCNFRLWSRWQEHKVSPGCVAH